MRQMLDPPDCNWNICCIVGTLDFLLARVGETKFHSGTLNISGPVKASTIFDILTKTEYNKASTTSSQSKAFIVSDSTPRMTSLIWMVLFKNMNTTLMFSSSFHPKTKTYFENANSLDLDHLKCYVSDHKENWEHTLPLVEYAYNDAVHSSTRKAPFESVEVGKKIPPILHTKDKIFEV